MSERVKAILLSVAIVVAAVASEYGALARAIDTLAYDFLLNKTKGSGDSAAEGFAIIGIDDDSIKKADTPLVLWIGYFAKVVNALSAAGAKAVVFDVIPTVSLDKIAPQIDLAFLQAMKEARKSGMPVVLGFKSGEIGGQMPHPKFAFMATGLGYTNLYPDLDGKMRRQIEFFVDKDGGVIPSLSLSAAMAYRGEMNRGARAVCEKYKVCTKGPSSIPMNIDYRIPREKMKVYSMYDILLKAQNGADLGAAFKGKVVFIGPMSEKLPDNHRVPLDLHTTHESYLPGLVIQTQSALTLLSSNKLTEIPDNWKVALTIFFSIVSIFLMFRFSPSRSSQLLGFGAMAFFAGAWFSFSRYLFIPVSPVFYGIFFPAGLARSYLYAIQYRQSRILKRYFGSYVSHEVMKDILNNPKKVNFNGSLVEITIMFTDIRNFTTLSENLSPVEVTKGLNLYLSAMTGTIIASGGYVNRYLGDGILALFGAPVSLPQKGALAAVKAGLAMQRELEKLNRDELFPGVKELRIGIGIHTGAAIVGNVGCHEKMDYTVIGDAANLASRIEGLTKQYGVALLASESTYELVKDAVEARYIDSVTVKGRAQATSIYHISSLSKEGV